MGRTHWSGPLLSDEGAQGGAAAGMHIDATAGEGDMVTVFDDFNGVMPTTEFGAASAADGTVNIWEENGWVMTDIGTPATDEVGMNDPADVDQWYPSCIRIAPSTVEDEGGNMQLDHINSSAVGSYTGSGTNDLTFHRREFPHLWIPETAAGVTAIDNTIWTFGCRVGLRADITTTGSGAWDSKAFIGWSVAGEAAIMTLGTGVLAVAAAADQLLGFHFPEDGSIDGISQRVGTTAYVEGTNFTELVPAGGVDGTTANGAVTAGDTMWFDLALRMTVTDWSETSNGATEFFYRRVPALNPGKPGQPGEKLPPWQKHGTALLNQVPLHTVSLVPTIEVINGPTADVDGVVYLDWWSFGCSRVSR